MPEKITLINELGESTQSDIISVFKVNNKKFIITTNNEVDPNGLTVLNISEVVADKLNSVADDKDWDAIKNIMRSIISGTDKTKVEYEPILSIANINSTNSFRYISVSNSAVGAMISDYATNKPVGDTTPSEPVVNITNAPSMNAFNNLEGEVQNSGIPVNNAIYPEQNNINDPNALAIANGINMVQQPLNQVDFEPVNNLVNPIDLMVNNEPIDNQNVIQSALPNIDINNTNNANMSFNNINPDASLEEIRKIAIDNITAIVTNYVDVIAQKEMEAVNQIRLENERKQQELLAQEELIKTKLMGMQNNPYQQPMAPNMMANGVVQPQMNMPINQSVMVPNMYQSQGMINPNMVPNTPDMNMANGVVQPQPQMGMPMNQGTIPSNMYQPQGMINQGVVPNPIDMNMANGVAQQDQQAA